MDYNIYLYSVNGEGSTGESSNTSASAFESNSASSPLQIMQKANSIISNPDSLVSAGVGMLSKAVPWVAIIIAGLKIADTIVTTISDNYSSYSGDYSFSLQRANFKKAIGYAFAPFRYLSDRNSQWIEWNKHNIETRENARLAGISINNISGLNV
jgi:hypothetical protein